MSYQLVAERKGLAGAAWLLTVVAVIGIALAIDTPPRASGDDVAVFSRTQRGIPIVIPSVPLSEERQAAEMLRTTLATSAGREPTDFPVLLEREAPRRAVFVGATRRGGRFLEVSRKPPFDDAVGARVQDGSIVLRSERRESTAVAAAWFLQRHVGAHWFMPGPLGEHVPRRDALTLKPSDEIVRPGFVSRDLGVGGEAGRAWYARNGLEARLDHSHNLVNIFRPEDYRRVPEMAPMRAGQRYIPSSASDYHLQPDLLSRAAIEHAAAVAIRAFDADPRRVSFSLSTNDAVRYDDSRATLAAVAPPRFFRHRPDYSDLVFGFTNAVAEIVAKRHPDRWLPAYAYYWCENTPRFPIARNVVPFLTADRSRWSFPEFAAEDRALIERWCKSGAELVGVYDYFYGAPFLSPRPTLYTVKETIPFHHRTGVRAFYAEMNPNWALDGPKPWLAAQLLWDPSRSPDELLEFYYQKFWAEAAAPMRRFFALCEETWKQQPGPPLWLRYFQDDHQSHIYSAAALARLRESLDSAAALARSPEVRARVAFASVGLRVTEAFADFCRQRDALSALVRTTADPTKIVRDWREYRHARGKFVRVFADVQREQPLAIAPQSLEIYLRNQPDSRAARELTRSAAGQALLRDADYLSWAFVGATGREIAGVTAFGEECLRDPHWTTINSPDVSSSAAVDWTLPTAAWRGAGEPWEGRTVRLETLASGERVLRMAGCRTESIGQWVAVTPNSVYAAQVRVRAKVSSGTAAFLVVTFLDEHSRHIDLGRIDRLPADPAVQETELCLIVQPPANARFIGFGVRVLNQVNDDFAEFSRASLRRLSR